MIKLSEVFMILDFIKRFFSDNDLQNDSADPKDLDYSSADCIPRHAMQLLTEGKLSYASK